MKRITIGPGDMIDRVCMAIWPDYESVTEEMRSRVRMGIAAMQMTEPLTSHDIIVTLKAERDQLLERVHNAEANTIGLFKENERLQGVVTSYAMTERELKAERDSAEKHFVDCDKERQKWQLLADCRQRLIEKQRAALEYFAEQADSLNLPVLASEIRRALSEGK